MITDNSEAIFADYLAEHGFSFERAYSVSRGDVDFKIVSRGTTVLCDVKEVRDPQADPGGRVEAEVHIRSDIRKLRAKFGKARPDITVVLVTMNFSSRFFTGVTVARALLGDIGLTFDPESGEITSPVHHLTRGNAALTQNQNRSISAVLVFDHVNRRHGLFLSPFADHPVPPDFFPDVQVIPLDRASEGDDLILLSKFQSWGIETGGES